MTLRQSMTLTLGFEFKFIKILLELRKLDLQCIKVGEWRLQTRSTEKRLCNYLGGI